MSFLSYCSGFKPTRELIYVSININVIIDRAPSITKTYEVDEIPSNAEEIIYTIALPNTFYKIVCCI